MANKNAGENGKKTRFKSGEEAAKSGRKGGVASGKSKRARKTLREELLALLEVDDVQVRMAAALIKEAVEGDSKGSVTKAFTVIRDTIGEEPVERVVTAEVDPTVIDTIEKMVNDDSESSS